MIFTSTTPGDLTFLTWRPSSPSAPLAAKAREAYEEIGAQLRSNRQVLLHERIYGELIAAETFLQTRQEVARELPEALAVPPTYVQGTPCLGGGIAGIHTITVSAHRCSLQQVELGGQVCGRLIRGSDARYLYLSDISRLIPGRDTLPPAEETQQTFAMAEQLLHQVHWSFPDVCRTWFYLRRILDWYDDFNQVRNDTFTRLGLFSDSAPRPIPASTGIRGRNLSGSWCTLDLLGIRALEGRGLEISRLSNPQQNEAPEYGSAFSRGLRVSTDSCCYVFVSGTASIDTTGESVFAGDFQRQTELTLETVQSLLASAGAGMSDICQATAFVKNQSDVEQYQDIISRKGLEGMPAVCTIGDVCRPELLFELDATAVLPLQQATSVQHGAARP